MSDHSLVVNHASLESIQDAIATAHTDIVSKVEDLLQRADAEMSGWAMGTASRAAEAAYRQRVVDGVQRLGEALERIRTTTAEVAELAQDAEVRNVAILD